MINRYQEMVFCTPCGQQGAFLGSIKYRHVGIKTKPSNAKADGQLVNVVGLFFEDDQSGRTNIINIEPPVQINSYTPEAQKRVLGALAQITSERIPICNKSGDSTHPMPCAALEPTVVSKAIHAEFPQTDK